MDAKSFFLLVSGMRSAQKKYFLTRERHDLYESKRLEKIVDDEIDRVNSIVRPKVVQGDLFES